MPVTLHVWRVPRRRVAAAMLRMAFRRTPPGVRFAKFLGTGKGVTFGPRDADLTRYAVLTVSDSPVEFPAWDRLAVQRARIDLIPLRSRGTWSGRTPFEIPQNNDKNVRASSSPNPNEAGTGVAYRYAEQRSGEGVHPGAGSGVVLALTWARLRLTRAAIFWRAIPPVARELAGAPGLLASFGVGEAPIGWQGTVSVWRDAADLTRFAYRQPEHRAVIARTSAANWYAEELFARFAVESIQGDREVLGWKGHTEV
jgi:hypothetical protein